MEETDDDIYSKIKIFSTTDDKLKHLGEILCNDSSRSILSLLIENELALGELSKKTGLSLSLVTHHINKMIKTDVVVISKITKNVKGNNMKHYRAKPGIIIFSHKESESAKQSKTFHNSLKRIFKFASIGIAALVSWIITTSKITEDKWQSAEEPLTPVSSDIILSVSATMGVVVIGLIIERVYVHFKK